MSIINQTLRELDARKDAAPAAPAPAQAPASPRRVVPALWGLAGALLVLAGVLLWLWPQPADMPAALDPMLPAANVPVAETPPPVAVEPVPVAPALALPAETPAPPAALPAEALAPPVDPTPSALTPMPVAAAVVPAPPAAALPPPEIRKQARQPTPEEDAETHYRKAIAQVRAGRDAQARPLLEAALQAFPRHIAARQMLATLLSEAGQDREAETVLNEGRAVAPEEAWFALALARLQAARGDTAAAAATLLGGQAGRGVNAEYRATLAALLVNLGRHAEAVRQYELALDLQPGQGTWWMGLGLALEAQGRVGEARAAFHRALAAGNLPDALLAFVREKSAE
ncbi:MAG: tetratricopeptide repeat protein [Thiobacillus sp.]|uniref:tetratricopeptide repeat protein n=1 Tax=Thiobacillus sp. TaxID=924 RepID=UPI0027358626|nr:tetratricopeptide repeat protein [Thiobacillus sp.]MDP3583616.1 tetratricopeptide repeat protein [Thiobacillus sp.]